MGVRIRGTLKDIDPLNKVPFKRATSRVETGPLYGNSLILPRNKGGIFRVQKATICVHASGWGSKRKEGSRFRVLGLGVSIFRVEGLRVLGFRRAQG